jgi:hypothetical protein
MSEKAKKEWTTIAVAGVIVALAVVAVRFINPPAEAEAPRMVDCVESTAECLGSKLRSRIQAPCTTAVERVLSYKPEWTDGMLEDRFASPATHDPAAGTIVFTGNKLLASNAFGAKAPTSYFCVVDESGSVVNAGIN